MHTTSASGLVLKILYNGTSKQLRCFKNVKIESFNFVYRNNKKAWMNTEIMIEYLKWFDKEMAGRKVVLPVDNFSAHKTAFEYPNSIPLTSSKNKSVIFLPPNVTSLHQPLDQSIIHAWKCHYHPVHGTVVPTVTEASLDTPCTEAEFVSLAERVASQRGIQNIPSINDFVTPTSEEFFDDINTSEEFYLEEIAVLFESDIQIENDEEDFEELGPGADYKKVDLDDAIAATKFLLKWQE
ncbi:hypothetical protein K3495_g2433 [Podosphaera aphanis]|nr:hypothetical protein K3495_g2433 [Podosphaera aphanis]